MKTNRKTTLEQILTLNLHNFEEEVKNIVDKAIKEMTVTKVLNDINETWNNLQFDYELHQKRQIKLLRVSEELIETLDDNQMQLQNISTSKHIDFLLPKVSKWQQNLTRVDMLITHWFEVQRKWIYLESIFIGSPDIRAQLPDDSKNFELIDSEFIELVEVIDTSKTVINVTRNDDIYRALESLEQKLLVCEKALNNYLETKRIAFPRFYFISSIDLLDILSNGNNPTFLDRHLIKLFDSILRLQYSSSSLSLPEEKSKEEQNVEETFAVGMFSKENEEYVAFVGDSLHCSGRVEQWLNKLIVCMRYTLHELFKEALKVILIKFIIYQREYIDIFTY